MSPSRDNALPASAELVIVGAGVVGAATCWHACGAGLAPLVLEARPAPCTLTTAAATAAFRLQFEDPEELELAREAERLLADFQELTGQTEYDVELRRQGYLWLTTEERRASEQRAIVARQHALGLTDVELLDGEELRARFPFLAPAVLQGRFRADDAFFDAKQLTMGLLAGSRRARIAVDCLVTGFRVAGGRLLGVETTRGFVSTPAAVIAAGPHSIDLLGRAGLSLPLQAVRRQKVVMPNVPEVPAEAPMIVDEDNESRWRPAHRGAFLLCMEDEPATPPAWDVPVDAAYAFRLLDPASSTSVARTAPFWREVWARNASGWWIEAGQYTMTPDKRPIVGPSGVVEGLYVNTGYSGHGLICGPGGGRLLVDLMRGHAAADDNCFAVDRWGAPRR